MSVLVTGGAGYIGSVTVDALVDTGDDVVVLDDLSTGFADSVNKAARFVRGDIGDGDLVTRLVNEHGVDACIHFAGKIAVGESVGDPAAYFDSNVARPLRLLDALVGSDVAKVVLSSSAAVYGDPSTVPIPEGHPTDPTNPYGRAKLMFESILSDYDVAYGVRSVLEVIDVVRQVTGRKVPVERGDRRAGDPTRLVADPRAANEVLGWATTSDSDLACVTESAWKHRS